MKEQQKEKGKEAEKEKGKRNKKQILIDRENQNNHVCFDSPCSVVGAPQQYDVEAVKWITVYISLYRVKGPAWLVVFCMSMLYFILFEYFGK